MAGERETWRPEFSRIKCRFGCANPVGIFHVPEGCACWRDPLQALCMQHLIKAESEGDIVCVVDWIVRPDVAGAGEQEKALDTIPYGEYADLIKKLSERLEWFQGGGATGSLTTKMTSRPDSQCVEAAEAIMSLFLRAVMAEENEKITAEFLKTAHLSGVREGREEAAKVAEGTNWLRGDDGKHVAAAIRANSPFPPAGETT